MTIRIAMWSGPRNISTAMMRSFGSRADCFVTDEPFYGAYLKDTGFDHPMAGEITAGMDCNWSSLAETLNSEPSDGSAIWYQKHMPSEMVGSININDLHGHRHAFLIRDPKRMIASYAKKMEVVTFEDMGLERQHLFYRMEADRLGHAPPVVEGADILDAPGPMLKTLCDALDIPWDPAMLGWEQGRRETDGIWAPHWYGRVEQSTGFEGSDHDAVDLPDEYRALYERCRPHYEALRANKLKPAEVLVE